MDISTANLSSYYLDILKEWNKITDQTEDTWKWDTILDIIGEQNYRAEEWNTTWIYTILSGRALGKVQKKALFTCVKTGRGRTTPRIKYYIFVKYYFSFNTTTFLKNPNDSPDNKRL